MKNKVKSEDLTKKDLKKIRPRFIAFVLPKKEQIKKEAFLINLLLPFLVNNYLVLRSLLSVALSSK